MPDQLQPVDILQDGPSMSCVNKVVLLGYQIELNDCVILLRGDLFLAHPYYAVKLAEAGLEHFDLYFEKGQHMHERFMSIIADLSLALM